MVVMLPDSKHDKTLISRFENGEEMEGQESMRPELLADQGSEKSEDLKSDDLCGRNFGIFQSPTERTPPP